MTINWINWKDALMWNEIWWFCASMTLEREIWHIMVVCLNDPWTGDMLYNGLMAQWLLNAKYYIWWVLCLDDPIMRKLIYDDLVTRCLVNEKYDKWWLCTSVTLECDIFIIVLWLEYPWLRNMISSLYDYKYNKLDRWYCASLTLES
jgi:hypothetical protein